MRLVAIRDGRLVGTTGGDAGGASVGVSSGVAALDRLAPGGAFARGAVHELLAEGAGGSGVPLTLAAALAGSASAASASSPGAGGGRVVAWVDPSGELYPPALAALGVDLSRLLVVRPADAAAAVWAAAACLACPAVAATVFAPPPGHRLTRAHARRLQLAAERGGGVGLLVRPGGDGSGSGRSGASGGHYAAATRWAVSPAPGDSGRQRWSVRLAHGHGGRVGEAVLLEVRRDDGTGDIAAVGPGVPLRAADGVADRARAAGAG